MGNELIPDRESLVEALQLVARLSDGQQLVLKTEEKLNDPAFLVGMLEAAVDDIAQRFSTGQGKGNSKRRQMVLGYKSYLARSDAHDEELRGFFQRRLERLVGDMRTSMKSIP